jgi:hypothetical protein
VTAETCSEVGTSPERRFPNRRRFNSFGLLDVNENRTFSAMSPEIDEQLFAFKDERSSNSR